MAKLLCTIVLAAVTLNLVGCATTPKGKNTDSSAYKPSEKEDAVVPPPSAVAPAPVPAPAPDPPPPPPECADKKDCKVKGKPGHGMRWACTEGVCLAEPKRHHR